MFVDVILYMLTNKKTMVVACRDSLDFREGVGDVNQ